VHTRQGGEAARETLLIERACELAEQYLEMF
jgi:hypothetical protein